MTAHEIPQASAKKGMQSQYSREKDNLVGTSFQWDYTDTKILRCKGLPTAGYIITKIPLSGFDILYPSQGCILKQTASKK